MEWVEVLAGSRMIVELPVGDSDDLVAAGEVLVQEGLSAWTVPFERRAELIGLREVFGRRVRLGVSNLRNADQVRLAAGRGTADLLLSPFASAELVDAAEGVPVVLGGLTPAEVATALELGRVTPQTVIQTGPGSYQLDKFTVRDTHNYGALTVEGVIQKSSNIGALKIAQRLSAKEMWDVYTSLGYGRKPDLTFPGAATGRLRPWKSWKPIEQSTMAYGYGLSASLFQMAHSYTAFAHDGVVIPATLLRSPDGQPVQGVKIFSEKTARSVRKMLQMAAGPGGTGQRAQTVGYSVGGKSGTARKQQGKGYAAGKYRAWFAGMAPIEQPRVIVAVMVDEPSAGTFYGGAVAAPVFSEVVQQTLRVMGVAPDMAVKPEIVTEQVQESF